MNERRGLKLVQEWSKVQTVRDELAVINAWERRVVRSAVSASWRLSDVDGRLWRRDTSEWCSVAGWPPDEWAVLPPVTRRTTDLASWPGRSDLLCPRSPWRPWMDTAGSALECEAPYCRPVPQSIRIKSNESLFPRPICCTWSTESGSAPTWSSRSMTSVEGKVQIG